MISFNTVKDFKVLMVGDGITDEYRYVKPKGKAIKDSALSVQSEARKETFNGGVWAAAAHVANFCRQVDIITGPHVMRNRYYVDAIYMRKLFNVHEIREDVEHPKNYDVRDYDLVIVTDFGHGTMTKPIIERLTKEARFLVVNAQTNTMNYGFNLVTKYRRADYVVLDELEARLAARDRDGDIEDVILALGFKKIIVTLGKNGAIGFDGAFERMSALTEKPVDTIGAGDAFLCVTAPFAAAGASMKDLLRIGNAAGAVKVGIVGHRASVNREALEAALG